MGSGAFGVVQLVEDKKNKEIFALKAVKKEFIVQCDKIRHIKRERELLNKLKHPHIIKLLGTFQDEKHLFFLFEYAENKMLEDLIKMCKRRLGEDLIKIYVA